MKNYLQKLLKTLTFQLIIVLILIGTATFAISWPTDVPIGETIGGNFMKYFNNIKGECSSGTVVNGFNEDFTKSCIVSTSSIKTWYTGTWGACSVSCGGGTQTRIVECRDEDGNTFNDSNCIDTKPSTNQSCNIETCCPTGIDCTTVPGLWVRTTTEISTVWSDAKVRCVDSTHGGYSDWYLPSKIEMTNIWNAGFREGNYGSDSLRSSNDYSGSDARYLRSTGSWNINSKLSSSGVQCVRSN